MTSGGSRYVVISLVRVYDGANPTRVRNANVEKVLFQVKTSRPVGVAVAVCMPPEPIGSVDSVYVRELQKVYRMYNALVEAPEEVS